MEGRGARPSLGQSTLDYAAFSDDVPMNSTRVEGRRLTLAPAPSPGASDGGEDEEREVMAVDSEDEGPRSLPLDSEDDVVEDSDDGREDGERSREASRPGEDSDDGCEDGERSREASRQGEESDDGREDREASRPGEDSDDGERSREAGRPGEESEVRWDQSCIAGHRLYV